MLKDLPPKTDETILVPLDGDQLNYYNEIKSNAKIAIEHREKDSQNLKNFYVQLRKVKLLRKRNSEKFSKIFK